MSYQVIYFGQVAKNPTNSKAKKGPKHNT